MDKRVKIGTCLIIIAANIVLFACGTKSYQEVNRTQMKEAARQVESEQKNEEIEHIEKKQQEADENLNEEGTGQQSIEQQERETLEGLKNPIPEGAKKLLDYLFDYLHPDKSNMVDVELYETKDELYYKWKAREGSNELSNSYVLAYISSSEEGEYYDYTAYSLIPYKGIKGEDGFIKSYGGYWKINSITKEIIPDAKKCLEYLFDELYQDQSDMVDIDLYETEGELYYKWKIQYQTGEISNPCVLKYSYTTRDGLYHEYATYAEVWEIYYDEEGVEHKDHVRDSYGDFILVNTESLEIITRWIPNKDKDSEPDYVENEKYWEIINSYAENDAVIYDE